MKIVVAEDDVVAVNDGAEGCDAWQREPPPLLVLDWLMPELAGVELTRRVRGPHARPVRQRRG